MNVLTPLPTGAITAELRGVWTVYPPNSLSAVITLIISCRAKKPPIQLYQAVSEAAAGVWKRAKTVLCCMIDKFLSDKGRNSVKEMESAKTNENCTAASYLFYHADVSIGCLDAMSAHSNLYLCIVLLPAPTCFLRKYVHFCFYLDPYYFLTCCLSLLQQFTFCYFYHSISHFTAVSADLSFSMRGTFSAVYCSDIRAQVCAYKMALSV